MRRRLFREQSRIGQRISAEVCAAERGAPGFHEPEPRRWRRELDFYGLVPLDQGLAQERRLLDWADNRGRSDGRVTRRWVARALLAAYRPDPEQQTIAAGGQWIADKIQHWGGPAMKRQNVQRILQQMQNDRVLFLAKRGCSAAITGTRNHVSVYVVVEPATLAPEDQAVIDELAADLDVHLPVGEVTRVKEDLSTARNTGRISPEPPGPQRREHPERYAPRNAPERAAAIDWIIAEMGWQAFQGRARAELQKPTIKLFRAGWSARGVVVAIGRRPDGEPHTGPLPGVRQRDRWSRLGARNMWKVVTWRLGLWKPDGEALPPPAADQPRRGRPRSAVVPTVECRRTAPGETARALLAQAGLLAGSLREGGSA